MLEHQQCGCRRTSSIGE
ncbi:hypothetical protein pipiens_000808, partial [Culex pipiens pipiens]